MHSVMHGYSAQKIGDYTQAILKAHVPGVSMRLPPCTDADDLLHCSATVRILGDRGEPDNLT